jgi:hypothetical protein
LEKILIESIYIKLVKENYDTTVINKNKYILIPKKESKKYDLTGNVLIIIEGDKLYKLENSIYIYNEFISHIKNTLNKHPYWARWCVKLEELKKIKNISLNVKEKNDFNIFDDDLSVLYQMLNNVAELKSLISENSQILKNYVDPLSMTTSNNFEFYLDEIHECIHNHKLEKFTRSFFSNKHKFLINDDVISKFNYIKNMIDKGKIDKSSISNYITNKISTLNGPNDIIILVNKFISDITGYSMLTTLEEISVNNMPIIYQDDSFLISEATSFEQMKKLGSTQWCIAQTESFFNQYIYKDNDLNRQFIVWDFSKEVDDPLSMMGFTINMLGEIKASYLKNDKPTPLKYRNIIDKKIPLISEEEKLSILVKHSNCTEDLLISSLKYNSLAGLVLAKKEVKYRYEDEDKVSVLILFSRLLTDNNRKNLETKESLRKEIDCFIEDIGVEISRLSQDLTRRILRSRIKSLLETMHIVNKVDTIEGLMDISYIDKKFFQYVYDKYLYNESINSLIKNELLMSFENIQQGITIENLKKFSKEELIKLLSVIVSQDITTKNLEIFEFIKSRVKIKLVVEEILLNIKDLRERNKQMAPMIIKNLLKFSKENDIAIEKKIINRIMFIAIKYNEESKINFYLIEYLYKIESYELTFNQSIKFDIPKHNQFDYRARINNLGYMRWISKDTVDKITECYK